MMMMSTINSANSIYSFDAIDCTLLILLPDIVMDLTVSGNSTLKEIKDQLLRELRVILNYANDEINFNYDTYIFIGVNKDAEIEEYYDESQMLCNLNLIDNVLKYIPQKKINFKESQFSSIVNHTIGITLDDLTKISDEFVNQISVSRKKYLDVAKDINDTIFDDIDKKKNYLYSATHMPDSSLSVRQKLQSMDHLLVASYIIHNKTDKIKKITELPKDANVFLAIKILLISFKEYYDYNPNDDLEMWAQATASDYILKISSLDEYMIDFNHQLINYDYIQNCLYNDQYPVLSLYAINDLKVDITEFIFPSYYYQNSIDNRTNSKDLYVNGSSFSFYIKSAQNICKEGAKIYIRSALFGGVNSMLCSEVKSNYVPDDRPAWNQILSFNIKLNEIPRSARLCISLMQKNVRKSGTERALGSICLNLYDYFGKLIEGSVDLSLGSLTDSSFYDPKIVNHSNYLDNAITISVDFVKFRRNRYQSPKSSESHSNSNSHNQRNSSTSSNIVIQRLKDIVNKDMFTEILEQDRDFLRRNMHSCQDVSASLPKLAQSIRWNNSKEVGAFYEILSNWSDLSLSDAMLLLSSSYFDMNLRAFAVKNLKAAFEESIADLGLYLLQLVQALKFESYIYNDLAVFLLKAALIDRNVGQRFFWYLRSEMHLSSCRIYFGVLLEAFCRGYSNFMTKIYPQWKFIEKLTELSCKVKTERTEIQIERLQFYLENQFKDDCDNIYSLINPSEFLGEIIVQNCKIKVSKKRPLFLEWHNPDLYCDAQNSTLKYIFKHGDDLRQDILTLQLLSIFDWIWKRQFQDMKLLPYGCLSVGKEMGLIEVVKDSKTVMDIQKKSLPTAIQMNPKGIYNWLLLHNNEPEKMEKAVENFTRSCAGYSVATFVLGIRDRHPDNIMVNKKGQLFHIDFGHILNNTKKLWAFNRERVPFVLPNDFLYVISAGSNNLLTSQKFQDFKVLCGQAYLELRKQYPLILTLFSLMMHSGLPELSSLQDLEYIRETLQIEYNNKQALEYFNKNLTEAYMYNLSVKLDWVSHYIKNHQID